MQLPAPRRDLDVVDPDARAYRIVSLYRFLTCDSQAHDPDPHDIRLVFEGRDPIEVRTQIAELVADRRRLYEALHAAVEHRGLLHAHPDHRHRLEFTRPARLAGRTTSVSIGRWFQSRL